MPKIFYISERSFKHYELEEGSSSREIVTITKKMGELKKI